MQTPNSTSLRLRLFLSTTRTCDSNGNMKIPFVSFFGIIKWAFVFCKCDTKQFGMPLYWGQGKKISLPNMGAFPIVKSDCPLRCEWSSRRSDITSAEKSSALNASCTEKPLLSCTTVKNCFPAWKILLRQRVIIRSWLIAQVCLTAWKSPLGPPKAKSWVFATKPFRFGGSSSIRNPMLLKTVCGCSKIS